MQGLDYIKAPDIPAENTAYVSPSFHYDTTKRTFPTIQEAFDYMYDTFGFVFGTTIFVYPGTYTEQIHTFAGYFIQGITRATPSSEWHPVVLYNTGADPDHYPLRANDGDGYFIKNIDITTDTGGVFGKLSNSRFDGIRFQGGSFIEGTENINLYETWSNCAFLNCKGFNLTGVAPQGRYLLFENCWFGWWNTATFESTHLTGNAVFDIDGGHFAFTKLSLKGDWYHFAKNYHSFGAYRTEYDTTKGIVYRNVTISNGIHFVSDPMSFKMIGCEMEDAAEMPIPDGEADITADVPITDVNFQNNSMHNGLSGEIEIQGNLRYVGGNAINKYISIQDAIDSLPSSGLIFLQPGTYTEQIHSRANIVIQGYTTEGVPAKKSTIIYNTGADAAHYPLRGDDDDYYVMNDVTIETDTNGVVGKFGAHKFSGCVFSKGHFIEATKNANMLMGLDNCTFLDSMAFNMTGVGSGGLRAVTIIGCFFNDYATHWKFDSTHTATLAVVKNCIFHKFYPDIGGNWGFEISDCHTLGSSRSVISTTNKVTFIKCILSNGLHFTSNPDAIIQLCTFNDDCGYPITGADITADVTVTDVDYVQNVQQNGLSGDIQTAGDVINVGGDSINRYYSIQDAIDSLPSGGVISLQPGTYTEQIHSTGNILIQGRTHEGVPAIKSTILYNTGVDAAHYPLGGNDTDVFNISDITIKTDADETIGKIGPHNFTGVSFENGSFIEATINQNMLMGFVDCLFKNTMAFNFTGIGTGGLRAMTMKGCYFDDYATHCKLDSTHTSTLVIIKDTIFHGFYPDIGGNWNVEMSNSHIFGTSRPVISTTNKISFIQCILSSGLHFTSNPDTIMHLCTFIDGCGYAITGEDITATLNVTDVDYVGNVQQNGLSGRIQIQCPVKPVGCSSTNKYYTIQDAVTSVPINGAGTVQIFEDLTGLSELTIPTGADVSFDAQKIYSISFTGDIVEIGANQACLFQNFVELNGSDIFVNGSAAKLKFSGCGVINAHVTITDGADVKIQRSGLVADTGYPAITMNDLTCNFTFGYSKLQGAVGYPAILTTAECDGRIKGKFSTLISGTAATISPLLYTGANKLDISLYNSALSGTFSAASFANLISSPNLTYDPAINY